MTPFRSEKNTNWEGAFRVPCMIRWPGTIQARHRSRTRSSAGSTGSRRLLAAAGDPDVKEKLLAAATQAGGKTFKVHLDGYNQLPYLTGQQDAVGAQGVLLLQRRRRPRRAALRELEGRVLEQRDAGHAANLGRAVHQAARPEAVRPAHRTRTSGPTSRRTPITTGSCRTSWRVPRRANAGRGGAVPRHLQGISAEAEGRRASASISMRREDAERALRPRNSDGQHAARRRCRAADVETTRMRAQGDVEMQRRTQEQEQILPTTETAPSTAEICSLEHHRSSQPRR